MKGDGTVLIPLYGRDRVRGFATIDAEDAVLVAAHRWNLSGGYATSGRLIMHRFILGLVPGEGVCHHVNEDKLDNRRANVQVFPNASIANIQPHPKRDEAGRIGWERYERQRLALGDVAA